MERSNFLADNWIADNSALFGDLPQKKAKKPQEILAPFYPKKPQSEMMQKYFVPGWSGESLISKHVKSFKEFLDLLHKDAKRAFINKSGFPRRIKMGVYEEFLTFAEFKVLNLSQLDSYQEFWKELTNEDSIYRKELDQFLTIFSFRIAVIYLLKARFIITLNQKSGIKLNQRDIVYPQAFLNRFFKTASSTELKSIAFEQSIYSWYRPSDTLSNRLNSFSENCTDLSITDIVKTISTKAETILGTNTDYSHTLSHKHFGLFDTGRVE